MDYKTQILELFMINNLCDLFILFLFETFSSKFYVLFNFIYFLKYLLFQPQPKKKSYKKNLNNFDLCKIRFRVNLA